MPMVNAAHWLTLLLVYLAQRRTCRVRIRIVLASPTIDFVNQKGSHYLLVSQWWSMIECWVSNACNSKQGSGVLNISSTVMR